MIKGRITRIFDSFMMDIWKGMNIGCKGVYRSLPVSCQEHPTYILSAIW